MDNFNFDEFLNDASEVEKLSDPIIEEVEIQSDVENYEEIGLKVKPFEKEDETKDWQSGKIKNDFWNYDYDNSKEADAIKKNKVKSKLLIVIIAVISVALILGIIIFIKSIPRKLNDVTNITRHNEKQLSEELHLSFKSSDMYTPKVRVLSEAIVDARADKGFSVVYVDRTQQGIFFDSRKYKLYGLSLGDTCDENFSNTSYKFNKTYMEVVDYHSGQMNYYYLYNTSKGDCMIVSVDSKTRKVLELGYFYDYKIMLDRLI